MNYHDLCLFVKEKKSSWMRIADHIKEMSLKNNFSHDSGVISEHFHRTTGLFNDLFMDIQLVTKELKRQFRFKQEQIVAVVKEEQPENAGEESPRVRSIKSEVNDLALLAQAVSEDIGDMLAELFDLLKDSPLNTHITNSILSEYGIQLDSADPIHLTRPAIKSSIYRGMKPIITQRLVPRSSDEDKSGITTYEEILQQAMLGARSNKVSLAEIDPKIAADQEDTTQVINRRGIVDSDIKPRTKTMTPGISIQPTVKELSSDNSLKQPEPEPVQSAALSEKAEPASTPAPAPEQNNQVKFSANESATDNILQAEPEAGKEQIQPEPEAGNEQSSPEPEVKPHIGPEVKQEVEPEITENPFRVQKSTRRKLWTMLGAGAAVVAAGLIGQSSLNNCSQDDRSVSVATTSSDETSDNKKDVASVEEPTQKVEEEASSPVKYTVNTDHADYARYLQNFKGMHAFQADLTYAAGHTEVELNGNESANEIKLKVLRKFLEAGVKTSTSAFSQKAFSMYLNTLDRLEKEIKDGISSIDDANLMEDGSYQQIRIMADGIKNVVRTVPPENIAGYKITRTACHPYEVFTHNYLDQGGAPAFHTTVVKTLENIEEDPFKRGDSGYVTSEFFKRLHRQAAVQRAQNKVDGSPAVAKSIERYIRAGGNNSISDMLRACVVPIYRADQNATPEPEIENTVAPTKGKAIPINYVPEPSPTGLFDLDKLYELDSGWDLPVDDTPEIEVTGEEYVDLNQLLLEDKDDTPEIEVTGEEYIELTEEDLLDDYTPEIEITGEEYVELSEEDFFFNDTPLVPTEKKVEVAVQEKPPVKKSWFSRAASKVKSFFT